MDLLQALVLGVVQGLTEFLPISSSAHLIIVPLLLGWSQPGLAFDMALHLGTLVAVVSFFWRDLLGTTVALARGLAGGRPLAEVEARLGLLLLAGSLPVGVAGLLFEHAVEAAFYTDAGLHRSIFLIGAALIGLALLMLAAERRATQQRALKDIRLVDALGIGLAQTVALIPGVSRSGSTIAAGLALGLSRTAAARFSFLLGTPAILAAGVKQVLTVGQHGLAAADWLPFAVGFLSSALVGYLCIKYLLRYLIVRTLAIFIVYRLILGVSLLAFGLLA